MTKKAIITTHDGREATIVTKASNVLFEDGQTAQDILNDRQDTMITPVITTSTSMSKIGQGDSVDYSDNVVNGAYESCVLKGNTKVNLIQESSKQDVVLPYEFTEGQYVTINDTKESGALGVELKGQTLVNLLDKRLDITSNQIHKFINREMTTGKKIFIKIKFPQNVTTFMAQVSNLDGSYKRNITLSSEINVVSLSSDEQIDRIKGLDVAGWDMSSEEHLKSFNEAIIIEYQEGMENWDIPYFEGMQSVQAPSVTTVGKNLFDMEGFLESSETNYTVEEDSNKFKIDHAKHHKNGIYTYNGDKPLTISYEAKAETDSRFRLNIVYTDGTHVDMGTIDSTETFVKKTSTTSKNKTVDYIRIAYNTSKYVWIKNLQIEESTTTTTYEPYKSTTLTTSEEITLRGIGNVKDTLNLQTGEYVQRIGEVVLDGSENWMIANTNPSQTATTFYAKKEGVGSPYANYGSQGRTLNDGGFNSEHYLDTLQKKYSECGLGINGSYVGITIQNSKLSTADATGFKQYLQSNPITVQYELATPITSTVSLTFTNQDNQPTTKLSTYNTTTHINASSQEGSLIPTLSHSNPTYPVILKPSTKYSIVANSYSNSHTNSPINFNLGGATASTTVGNRVTTITTPSTLSNELLTMSGRGNKLNNVMVIEGDVVGDEPYFEGICDCKSPILSNVGKNLFDQSQDIIKPSNPSSTNTYFYDKLTNTSEVSSTNWSGFYKHPIKTVVGETYYCYSEVTWGAHISIGTHENAISGSDNNNDSIYQPRMGSFVAISDVTYVTYGFRTTNRKGYVRNVMVSRSPISKYEPYKSNILSCNGDKIELTADMLEQGTFSTSQTGATYESVKENSNTRIRSKKLMRVKPNTTYRFKFDSSCQMLIGGYDSNQKCLGSEFAYTWLNEKVFTTPANGHYISIAIRKGSESSNITPSEFNSTGLAIWEVDKTIVLRSLPNGVCDTLDLMTGEYVQRIGEVTVDDSWDIKTNNVNTTTTCYYTFKLGLLNRKTNSSVYCNKFVELPNVYQWWLKNAVGCFGKNGNSAFYFILDTKEVEKVGGVLNYLTKEPVVIQYELATPITTTIDVQGFPYAYKDGHIQLTSGSIEQSLTPKVEYSVPTNRNGQIRSNQKMVERHQKQLDKLQAIILANLVNSQYNQTLTTLNYELSRV